MDDNCEWNFSIADDNNPPTVSSTSPNSGATGVAITSAVTATFSEVVVIPSDAFTLKDSSGNPVPGILSFPLGTTATFTPLSPLSGSTSYTATIKGGSTGVKDLSGNAMTSDKVWSFTTGADTSPLTIASTNPVSGATDVPVTSSIKATFNKPVQPGSVSTTTFTLKIVQVPQSTEWRH